MYVFSFEMVIIESVCIFSVYKWRSESTYDLNQNVTYDLPQLSQFSKLLCLEHSTAEK